MTVRRLRFSVAATAGAGVASLCLVGTSSPHPAAATAPIGFATPTVVDPVNLFGEPDLHADVTQPGTWYSSGPWGTGTQRSIWDRSTDGAHTFRVMHDHPDPVHTGGSLFGPGGGDTEITTDHTGKLYLADLAALATQHVTVSTDRGKSFTTNSLPRAFEDTSGTDRQWFGLWDPPPGTPVRSAYKGPWPVNYMVYLEALGGSGETVVGSVPSATDSSQVGLDYGCGPTGMGVAACPNWPVSNDGYVAIDQVTGKVLQAIGAGDSTKGTSKMAVEVLTPGANGYMAKAEEHDVAAIANQNTGDLFPTIALDAQRNAYVVWIDNPTDSAGNHFVPGKSWQVFYSWSPPGPKDDWSHWSPPVRISSAPSNTAVMPWVVAGGDGNVDAVWYGTDATLQTFTTDNDPATAKAVWYLYMAQIRGANTATPVVEQVRPVDHAMHHGSICIVGTGCITQFGNRNLADFFEVTTDASGAAYIVYNNTANDLIQQAPVVEQPLPEGEVDHKGAEVAMVVRQVSGPGLNGNQLNTPADRAVNGIVTAAGDALYDPINGTSYDGLDVLGLSLTMQGDKLHLAVPVKDPTQIGAALQAIGAPFVDYVVRWEFKDTIYFGELEVSAAGVQTFFDGKAQSIDLCSVSGCDPHLTLYPGPTVAPLSSHIVSGQVVAPAAATPGAITVDVPLADVGSPKAGDHLDSVGAYSLVSSTSALLPLPNALAEADIAPVEVKGACCFTPVLGQSSAPNPVVLPPAAIPGSGGPNPNTSAATPVRAAAGASVLLLATAAVAARRRRRRRSG